MTNILHFAEVFARKEDLERFMEQSNPDKTGTNIRFVVMWDEFDAD